MLETGGDVDWADARRLMMLDPGVINLNTGSFCPQPRVVFDRATDLRRRQAEEPMDFLLRQLPPLLWQARERLAHFLGGDPHRLVFTQNVSTAINIVASSLRLAAPGEVLLTDHEYGSMHWCWERAAQRQGLTLRTVVLPPEPRSPDELVGAVAGALTERTRLLFFSHVIAATGTVMPAGAICAEARRRGVPTVIDGAHAVAMVPAAVDALGCDYYAGNCHKWLLAPIGAGFLAAGPGGLERLQPLQVSWGYHPASPRPDERDEFGSTPRLRALEFEGTRDLCPWLAVPAALDFLDGLGLERVRGRIAGLARYARGRLGPSLRPVTPERADMHGALTAFRLPPGTDAAALRRRLWERARIEALVPERPEGPLLRVSTHFYNTTAEIDRLADVLPSLLA